MAIPKKIMSKKEAQRAKADRETDMTKALAVVMAIQESNDIFASCFDGDTMQSRVRQQVTRIAFWANECILAIRDKVELSDKRERDFMRKFDEMNASRMKIVGLCAGSTLNWSAWIYALDVLLWDTKAMMKPMTKKRSWRFLCMTWGTLNDWMLYTVRDERMQGGPYDGFDAEDLAMELYNHMQQNFQYSGRGSDGRFL